jgi:hypothetical protein
LATEPLVLETFCKFLSLPPSDFVDPGARAAAFRTNSGILLARSGKDPRPISAPSIFRKITSAIDARASRPAASTFCERRGQFGLSHPGALLAYSILPRLVVELGGTSVSADNENSFQCFSRAGLLTGAATLFSSTAALEHPSSTAAVARLFDRCIFDSAVHQLPRTITVFAKLGHIRVSNALSQGCSSSPTAEAITLASAPPSPSFPLSLRRSAHDDFQASGLPGCPLEAFAPPSPWGGSRYNTAKSVAVGPAAKDLVARGYAARASTFVSVFGAPVGDVEDWLLATWAPRFRRVMGNLKRAFDVNPSAAILTANSIKGPGASAAHWLRSTPVHKYPNALKVLQDIDDEWVHLLLYFAGYDHSTASNESRLTERELSACYDRTFGSGPSCLAHISAAQVAPVRYQEGISRAWPTVSRWVAEMSGADWRTFAKLLGAPDSAISPQNTSNSGHSVDAYFREAASQASEAYREACAAATERVRCFKPSARSNLSRGAQASIHAASNGFCNFWVAALGRSGTLTPAGPLADVGCEQHAGLHLTLLFGLPVWRHLGATGESSRPVHCKHCGAAALPAQNDARVPRLSPAAPGAARPLSSPAAPDEDCEPSAAITGAFRKTFDIFGLHAQVCPHSGILAGAKWKHDSIVRRLATLSAECGRGGRYHDRPIFTFGAQQRPADALQDARDRSRYPAGEAIDFTIGLEPIRTAAGREQDKNKKFESQLRWHQCLQFSPFGATHDGEVGESAHRLLLDWARALATRASALRLPLSDCRGEINTAAARAITRATIFQLVQWSLYERRLPRFAVGTRRL